MRLTLAVAALLFAPFAARADSITVFAAASLKSSLTQIGALWTAQSATKVSFSFAGTSALAKQIQQGAPADIFISASHDWMDRVIATGDIRAGSRRDILGNTLVLVAYGADVPPILLDDSLDLAQILAGGKLAMALVDAVPAGIYGKQALMSLGLWDGVSHQIAQAENVTGALQFVAAGEADLGIVYATDVAGLANISVLGTFPAGSHGPITYPAAITAQSTAPLAADFLDFLSSPSAAEIWRAAGFGVVP